MKVTPDGKTYSLKYLKSLFLFPFDLTNRISACLPRAGISYSSLFIRSLHRIIEHMLYFFALIPAETMTRQQLLNEVEHDIKRKPNSINIIYHSPVWRSVSGKTVPEVLDTTSGPLAEGSTNNRGNNILFF